MPKLEGRTAIVTGGSRGIGRGICRELALEGANIVVNYTSHPANADEVVAEVQRLGVKAIAIKADVSVKADVEQLVAAAKEQFGRIDILVNNAGICEFTEFFDIDEELWRKTIDVNLAGPFFCSQAAGRVMMEQGKGSIINISTVTSFRGGATQVHYASSKGGLNSLASSMVNAVGKYGIRVNTILCGGVTTDINRFQVPKEMQVPKAKNKYLPAGRSGDPEDLGKAVVYFASDDSEWVTGSQLAVDGGGYVV